MSKTRKNKKSIFKTITLSSKQTLPIVNKSLQNVTSIAKDVVVNSGPIVEKGVSTVYGTMATGFDLGIKGVNNVTKSIKKITKKRKNKRKKTKKRH